MAGWGPPGATESEGPERKKNSGPVSFLTGPL
jgi:hypothetical protein